MSGRSHARYRENDVVSLVRRQFGGRSRLLLRGIGDDAAVFAPSEASELWVVTTDLLLENIHFKREWMTPRQLGYKALAVNLSDIAAMGALPRFYCVSMGIPRGISMQWLTRFYQGLDSVARPSRTVLIGGDLSGSRRGIQISIAVLGESSGKRIVYRSGGKPGDFLYVTGVLGRSAAGLHLLKRGRLSGRNAHERDALASHRRPQPRCKVGAWLARKGYARAMMDLSDGLSVDLPRLCAESGTGAEILLSRLPTFEFSRRWGVNPRELALHGGEDYELLFAVAPNRAADLEREYPLSFPRITKFGKLRERRGVVCRDETVSGSFPIPAKGFDHFGG